MSTLRLENIYIQRTFVREDGVILGRDVVSQVMVQDQPQETVQKSEVDLLVDLGQDSLHRNVAFAFAGLPDVSQVVDALAPLVDQ